MDCERKINNVVNELFGVKLKKSLISGSRGARWGRNDPVLLVKALPGVPVLDLSPNEALPWVVYYLTILQPLLDLSCIYCCTLLGFELGVNAAHHLCLNVTDARFVRSLLRILIFEHIDLV